MTHTHREKTFWKGPNNLGHLIGRLPKFYFTSARLNCIPQNRHGHQIMTICFSNSRICRSFTGKRQHFEIINHVVKNNFSINFVSIRIKMDYT